MDYNDISPRDYLREKNIEFREANGELILKCPFDRCDEDSAENEAHCYMSADAGQFQCKKCLTAGGLKKFAEHLGDVMDNVAQGKINVGKPKTIVDLALIDECHGRLPFRIKQYLNDRGITDEIIKEEKIGFGEFYGKWRITIPVKDKNGGYLFLKLRRDPEDETDSDKYKIFPAGCGSGIYGLDKISEAVREVVICEGELDQLILGK
ncbi:MAG TPA: hypothetical protein VK254_03205, partial [Candidatus Bathyarchaeia archaeon]|nr:hypothetical protein [Candidatus Bathyarchaeia archaeon]